VFISLLFFFDIAFFKVDYSLKFDGVYSLDLEKDGNGLERSLIVRLLPMIILFIITYISLLTSVFFFKKRMIQMRFCVFNIMLLAGMIFIIFYYTSYVVKTYNMDNTFPIGVICPMIAIILNVFAMISIWKDELLVRSYDRIR
jgi:hypothetical protein